MSKFLPFNINDYVRVKLTDHGREVLRKAHDELAAFYPQLGAFRPPREDENGWSKWQMHDLMKSLGGECGVAQELPFETGIEIEIKETV